MQHPHAGHAEIAVNGLSGTSVRPRCEFWLRALFNFIASICLSIIDQRLVLLFDSVLHPSNKDKS